MSVESDLLQGIAARIAAAGVGTYPGPYSSASPAVVFGDLPTSPDKAIGLTVYSARDAQTQNLTYFRVQAFVRGAKNNTLSAGDLAAALFDVLHGVEAVQMGAVWVVSSSRVVVSPQGLDGDGRSLRADSYEFVCNTPTTPARPG